MKSKDEIDFDFFTRRREVYLVPPGDSGLRHRGVLIGAIGRTTMRLTRA